MQSSKKLTWAALAQPAAEEQSLEIHRTVQMKERRTFLVIHSKDRDLVHYPSPSRYRMDIADMTGSFYSNVKYISLHSAIIPNCNAVLSQPYLLLKLEELSGSAFAGTNSASQQAMALLMLDKPYDTAYINIRPDLCRPMPEQVTRPNLTSMTISLMNQYGALFDFGTDSASTIDDSIQHTLVFEIVQSII